ncbi:uncharacterized protein [Onthophagus taurus]|uniref:uncharacterized protein n=1 Tax=Onthophagus taurus TaxID=166361 RepID=UPI0039BE479C
MKYFLQSAYATIFAFWKTILCNFENKVSKNGYKLILKLLTFSSLLLITAIILPFVVYRILIWIYLKLKHKNDFLKIFNFIPSSYFMMDGDYATMKIFLLIESEDGDTIERKAQDFCKAMCENVPEVTGVVKRISGYYYLLKNRYIFDDFFMSVSFNDGMLLTKEKLGSYVTNCAVTNQRLFKIVFFKEPLEKNRYAILFLLHHGISDGHGVWLLMYKYLCDKESIPSQNNLLVPRQQTNFNDPYIDTKTLTYVANHNEPSICKGPYFAIFVEEEISCVPKLKALRKRFNCSMNELFLGIITYNLYRNMNESLDNIPNNMLMGYIHHFLSDYQKDFRNMFFPRTDISNNTYLMAFLAENVTSCSCIEDFIECVRQKSQEAIKSVMLQGSYALSLGVLDFLPKNWLHNFIIRQVSRSILFFSNVGITKGITVGGKRIVGILGGMSPGGSGICTGVVTCNDRLNIMLSTKLPIFNSQDEVQDFMESCIASIHELYEKVTSYSY